MGCVNYKQCSLAGIERTRNLVVKVDVAGGIYKIENIVLTVFCLVVELDGARLDSNSALLFKIHIIKQLLFHVALFDRFCCLKQAIGKRRLAVVNMGNDGKVPDVFLIVLHILSPIIDFNDFTINLLYNIFIF